MAIRRKKPTIEPDVRREVTDEIRTIMDKAGSLEDAIRELKAAGIPAYGDLKAPLSQNMSRVQTEKSLITDEDQIFANLYSVAGKAILLRSMIENAQNAREKLYIPVEGMDTVRKAISRVFPGSTPNHDKIYFPMWQEVVDRKVKQAEFIGSTFLEQLTGNDMQDSQILQDSIKAWELYQNQMRDKAAKNGEFNTPNFSEPAFGWRERVIASGPSALAELLVYGAALVVLYFLNHKLAMWKAPQTYLQSKASTLMPNPAGVFIMIMQIIIGLAMHFLIEGLLAEEVETVLDLVVLPEDAGDIDKAEIVDAAKALANNEPIPYGRFQGKTLADFSEAIGFSEDVLDVIKSYFRRGDYDIIYEYGISWLTINAVTPARKEDFSHWFVLPELESMIYDVQNSLEQAPNFSPMFAEEAKATNQEPVRTDPVSTSIDTERQAFNRAVRAGGSVSSGVADKGSVKIKPTQEVVEYDNPLFGKNRPSGKASREAISDAAKDIFSPSKMLDNVKDAFHQQACAYNEKTNRLAAFLTDDPWVAAAICCFVRYFGAVDVSLLHSIRSILQLFAKGLTFDLGAFLNKMMSDIYDDMLAKARASLVAIINKTFDKIFNYVFKWLDSEAMQFLMNCLPLNVVIRFMLNTIEEMKVTLDELIDDILEKIDLSTMTLDYKISILKEQKWARSLFILIDAIIEAVERGNNCALTGDPFEDPDTRRLLDAALKESGRQNDYIFYNNLSGIAQDDFENQVITDLDVISGDGTGSKNSRKLKRIQTKNLKDLILQPSIFNTFSDTEAFYTDNDIPINPVGANLRNRDLFIKSVGEGAASGSLSIENIESCFEDINQSELLKRVMRTV